MVVSAQVGSIPSESTIQSYSNALPWSAYFTVFGWGIHGLTDSWQQSIGFDKKMWHWTSHDWSSTNKTKRKGNRWLNVLLWYQCGAADQRGVYKIQASRLASRLLLVRQSKRNSIAFQKTTTTLIMAASVPSGRRQLWPMQLALV